jgi:Fic family protein
MVSRADAALSELSGVGRLLPNPHLLIAPLMAREAILSSRIAVQQSSKLIDIRERYRETRKDKARAAALLDDLMMNPFITVLRAQKSLRVSNPTARKTVELLIKRGIIAPLGDRRWGKVYVSKEILAAIEQK